MVYSFGWGVGWWAVGLASVKLVLDGPLDERALRDVRLALFEPDIHPLEQLWPEPDPELDGAWMNPGPSRLASWCLRLHVS
jgi:hypothetical protein